VANLAAFQKSIPEQYTLHNKSAVILYRFMRNRNAINEHVLSQIRILHRAPPIQTLRSQIGIGLYVCNKMSVFKLLEFDMAFVPLDSANVEPVCFSSCEGLMGLQEKKGPR
jgi:hypothetical protein